MLLRADKRSSYSYNGRVFFVQAQFHFFLRNWSLVFRFPNEIIKLLFDPVFSNWVNFIEEMPIINCTRNSNSFKVIYIFL